MKAKDKVYVWFDPEGDFLEVTLDASKEGDMKETADRRIAVKIDDGGSIIGFHILHVSSLMDEKGLPFEVDLSSRSHVGASATR
ncbi:MAG: DUF2283 domain-containing protein [Dehalococcoidia bacterium]|nr:DUF2283 domain-containing protein [Dehalococcoidia bacterium]MYG81751.1 DUF2283 domain-containing protein [Gemmatimonadota bacterium]